MEVSEENNNNHGLIVGVNARRVTDERINRG
jgi:hypothetical protein